MTDPTSENGEIETDFEVGQDNIDGSLGPIGFDIHNPVFVISGLTSVVFVLIKRARSFSRCVISPPPSSTGCS